MRERRRSCSCRVREERPANGRAKAEMGQRVREGRGGGRSGRRAGERMRSGLRVAGRSCGVKEDRGRADCRGRKARGESGAEDGAAAAASLRVPSRRSSDDQRRERSDKRLQRRRPQRSREERDSGGEGRGREGGGGVVQLRHLGGRAQRRERVERRERRGVTRRRGGAFAPDASRGTRTECESAARAGAMTTQLRPATATHSAART